MASAGQAFFVALIVSLAVTPVIRRLAVAIKAFDQPCERSVHRHPVPFLGGLAVFAAFVAAMGMGPGFANREVQGIVAGAALILFFGILDDYFAFSPKVKLIGQTGAAGLLVAFGVRIDYVTDPFGSGLLYLGTWAVPITILWVVAVINVINLIDGLDGLAAGVSAVVAGTLVFSALQSDIPLGAVVPMAAALAGGAIGFLPYNFNPARIFLGDAGSMFLGFVIAAISVEGSLKGPAVMTLAVSTLAMGLPILDTFLAIVRRWRLGRPIGQPDREHIHHRLLQLGFSQRKAVAVMYLVSAWLGIGALAVTSVKIWLAVAIVSFAGVTLAYIAWRIGMFGAAAPVRHRRLRFLRSD